MLLTISDGNNGMVFVGFYVTLNSIMKRHSILTMTSSEKPVLEHADSVDTTDLPLLPLRDTVLFPGVVFPVQLGREASLKVEIGRAHV